MTLVVAAPMLEDEVAFLVRVELDRIPVEHVGQTFPSSRGKIMSASNISRWRCHRLVEPQVELPGREMWAHGGVTIYIYMLLPQKTKLPRSLLRLYPEHKSYIPQPLKPRQTYKVLPNTPCLQRHEPTETKIIMLSIA